ncbi:glycosyltransferase family 9 protein [Candidatus Rhabdochlamydia sp. T3358]|uniref:glycosyltransferase family 9 protein n=1 Tax=Candidatus Rhabdochlamydia sp. T3358 TaxID=2099795 RepID=UPI0010B3E17C|nr:glycosyltransferase family 9 protein [Candidatus Rhabdochlamydia sp. T3358]VHO04995.1 lipopolysaccharide core biosynthesis protein [Candidatus Rhabdochlamydia sp. T3358]
MNSPRYLVNNRFGKILLRGIDAILPVYHKQEPIVAPRKILLVNLAHLGDVVITTAMLAACKELWPQAEMGVLIGSWAHLVVKDHPLIQNIHLMDHWKLNAAAIPFKEKIKRYYRTARLALAEIKQQQYDLAVDLYPFFPNAIFWLWKAGIPYRAGWTTGGFGSLLTHPLKKIDRNQGMGDNYRDLLSLLVGKKVQVKIRPQLPPMCKSLVAQILPKAFLRNTYLVFHMGTKESPKLWLEEKWRILTQKCIGQGFFIVFTGLGKEEACRINRITYQLPNVFNAANLLNWQEFAAVIQKARHLVSVDSSAVHIASAYSIPTTIIFSGINSPVFCGPLNPKATLLFKKLTCVPCLNRKGCSTMNCIREITPDEVLATIIKTNCFVSFC